MLLRCCAGLRSDASCLAQTHTCTRCTPRADHQLVTCSPVLMSRAPSGT
jgi:hypothetical protein